MKNKFLKIAFALSGIATLTACDSYKIIDAHSANFIANYLLSTYNQNFNFYLPKRFNIVNKVGFCTVVSRDAKIEKETIVEQPLESTFTVTFDTEQRYAYLRGNNLNASQFSYVFFGDDTNYYLAFNFNYSEKEGGETSKYYAKFDKNDNDTLDKALAFSRKACLYISGYYTACISTLMNILSFTNETYETPTSEMNNDYSQLTTMFKSCGDDSLRSKITLVTNTSTGGINYKYYSSFEDRVLRSAVYKKENKYETVIDESECNVTETYDCSISLNEKHVNTTNMYKPSLQSYEEMELSSMLETNFYAEEN